MAAPALDVFEDNMADAYLLVDLAEGLTNARTRRVRSEVRARIGAALRIPVKQREALDCVESGDLWVVLKPNARLRREQFTDHKPLLRQALVVACAATETYLADRVMERVSDFMVAEQASRTLREVPLTLGDWLDVDAVYTKKTSGLKYKVFEPWVRREVSTHPDKVGKALRLLGVTGGATAIDKRRPGETNTRADLERITDRRNKIAHTGDRRGQGKAPITAVEVREDLAILSTVVHAFEELT
ncbi:hypothetical protein HNR19_003130 [Nocardioides thalensis]|uniref:RiboL-PSP-HEPN domain-containing protein n=1 Tax=Nocardioides thalensis TaxID=1914755 RepID=A0A853C6X4_9ACTN|nr:hypothetical protein [Nocardioides thalensis]NYJ02432.1 hypothetical protein [Nocardioides thalensis]